MEVVQILKRVELFDGLTPQELESIAELCREEAYESGEVIAKQGDQGDKLYVICEGFVEVLLGGTPSDESPRTVVNLGRGQIVGEMALVDHGPRSATVRAIADDETVVQAIQRDAFDALCERNHHLGYVVMRNMAADLSFKLRHRHLASRQR
jgi:CRP-like cAMP-binding protein